MAIHRVLILIVLSCIIPTKQSNESVLIWPIPQEITAASGPPVKVSAALGFNTESSSKILQKGIQRYQEIFQDLINPDKRAERKNDGILKNVQIKTMSDNEKLDESTSYKYTLSYSGGDTLQIVADSPFGAIYGLETLSQIVVKGNLLYSKINITDWPRYQHRGLMLDSGRRFCPLALIYSTLDAMSYAKMNVFHWHFADFCRFSIESKLYPQLRNNEKEIYTQDDVRRVIEYAKDRGIRVVPEVEIAMHVHGMEGLAGKGLRFCDSRLWQLYNDPKNETVETLKILLKEMSDLFPDKLFHLGCDETEQVGQCTLKNTRSMETEIFKYMMGISRVPYVWEEALTVTDAAISGTVIQVWRGSHVQQMVDKGFMTIDADSDHFYLDTATRAPEVFWTDIASGVSPDKLKLVLGGEVAMWTDNYCFIQQCVTPSKKPVAWWMYDQKYDAEFTLSMGGMMWPRGLIGAGSFWNYVPSVDPAGSYFKSLYTTANQRLENRKIITCPNGCTCDDVTRCGLPIEPGSVCNFTLPVPSLSSSITKSKHHSTLMITGIILSCITLLAVQLWLLKKYYGKPRKTLKRSPSLEAETLLTNEEMS